MNISPTLNVDGKSYELLCGPFNKYEDQSFKDCISGLGKIAYHVAEINGDKYVYRDAKGFISPDDQTYEYKYLKPMKLSSDKLFLAQIMKEVRDKRGINPLYCLKEPGQVPCAICGKSFMQRRYDQRYCNADCLLKSKSISKKAKRMEPMMEIR